MKVIILAAGKGSRMELKDGQSKCSLYIDEDRKITTVGRLINQISRIVRKPEFIVVLGYGAESVVSTINFSYDDNINFIYNPYYETRGCNYSLSCAHCALDRDDETLILEGDSVYSEETLERIIKHETHQNDAWCLVRGSEGLSTKSVGVLTRGSDVVTFMYDPLHKNDFEYLSESLPKYNNSLSVYDSMQVWKFNPTASTHLKQELHGYFTSSFSLGQETGVHSINKLLEDGRCRMSYILSPLSDMWTNLNTQDDLNRVRKLIKMGAL